VAISETESKDISRCSTDYNYADYNRSAGNARHNARKKDLSQE